jgi:hypothetical protein
MSAYRLGRNPDRPLSRVRSAPELRFSLDRCPPHDVRFPQVDKPVPQLSPKGARPKKEDREAYPGTCQPRKSVSTDKRSCGG